MDSNDICDPLGLEGMILKQASKKLNFRYALTHIRGKNPWEAMMLKVIFFYVN